MTQDNPNDPFEERLRRAREQATREQQARDKANAPPPSQEEILRAAAAAKTARYKETMDVLAWVKVSLEKKLSAHIGNPESLFKIGSSSSQKTGDYYIEYRFDQNPIYRISVSDKGDFLSGRDGALKVEKYTRHYGHLRRRYSGGGDYSSGSGGYTEVDAKADWHESIPTLVKRFHTTQELENYVLDFAAEKIANPTAHKNPENSNVLSQDQAFWARGTHFKIAAGLAAVFLLAKCMGDAQGEEVANQNQQTSAYEMNVLER